MNSSAHTALRWSGNLHHHSSFITTKHPTDDSLEARFTDSTLSILNYYNEEDDDQQQQQEEEEGLHPLLLPRASHPTPPPSSSSSVNNGDIDTKSNPKSNTTMSSLPRPVCIPRLSITRIVAEAELMEKQQQQQQQKSRNLICHPPTLAANGLPRPKYWITYGHSPDTLNFIKHTNSIITRKLTSLANTLPSTGINEAMKQHGLRLANAREASRAKKAAEEAAATRENERVSRRLKAVKASNDVGRQALKKEYARQREIFKRLCRMPRRPTAMA